MAERGWLKYHYLDSWYSIYTFSRWLAPFATMDELLVKLTIGRVGLYPICVPVRKLCEAPLVAHDRKTLSDETFFAVRSDFIFLYPGSSIRFGSDFANRYLLLVVLGTGAIAR